MTKRALGEVFFNDLATGKLRAITQRVIEDRDLILELRGDYLNIYFKGQNLVAIKECRGSYACGAHERFLEQSGELGKIESEGDCQALLERFPQLKNAIGTHKAHGSEFEAEQLLIRANNYENAVNGEYLILDRQFVEKGNRKSGRPDLLGIYWSRNGRQRIREVPLVLFEVKYGLNPDISKVATQLSGYYDWLHTNIENRVSDIEQMLQQKIDLGLFGAKDKNQLLALRNLKITSDPKKARLALVLVDYNPHSKKLVTETLKELPFSEQIRVMYVGFGLWDVNVKKL